MLKAALATIALSAFLDAIRRFPTADDAFFGHEQQKLRDELIKLFMKKDYYR